MLIAILVVGPILFISEKIATGDSKWRRVNLRDCTEKVIEYRDVPPFFTKLSRMITLPQPILRVGGNGR